MRYGKVVGSILLVSNTAIGGGILALPAVTGSYSIYSASALLILVWLFNTCIAFLLLEANLWLPAGSSLISMAESTLGRLGKWSTWLSCILFLYTLIAAYISGLSEMLQQMLAIYLNVGYTPWLMNFLVAVIFASCIFLGTHTC
jgi:tyrosine-specific transport protein